jgi:hypothetical protein
LGRRWSKGREGWTDLEVSGRVLDGEDGNGSVLSDESESLRTRGTEEGRGVEDQAEGGNESSGVVSDESDLGALLSELLGPGLHDKGVVDSLPDINQLTERGKDV